MLAIPLSASAGGFTPAQISLLPDGAQLPTSDVPVRGISLNPYFGMQKSVTGAELGVLNFIDGDLKGAGVGLANATTANVVGAQLSAMNVVGGKLDGVQIGALASQASDCRGLQIGVLYTSADSSRGACLQLGLMNFNASSIVPVFPILNISIR